MYNTPPFPPPNPISLSLSARCLPLYRYSSKCMPVIPLCCLSVCLYLPPPSSINVLSFFSPFLVLQHNCFLSALFLSTSYVDSSHWVCPQQAPSALCRAIASEVGEAYATSLARVHALVNTRERNTSPNSAPSSFVRQPFFRPVPENRTR